jgi:hypothetical protein
MAKSRYLPFFGCYQAIKSKKKAKAIIFGLCTYAHNKRKEIFEDDRSPTKIKEQQYNQIATRAGPHFHPQHSSTIQIEFPARRKQNLILYPMWGRNVITNS